MHFPLYINFFNKNLESIYFKFGFFKSLKEYQKILLEASVVPVKNYN